MIDPEAITLDLPALTLRGQAFGPQDGHPVLALHGWLDSSSSFSALAPGLSGLRIFALDLAGHGLSDHRAQSASYDFVSWIPEILAAADALGLERFGLLGHSMGAGIASLLAGTFSERVTRLALIEGFGPLSEEAAAAPERLARHVIGRPSLRQPRVMRDRDEAIERVMRGGRGLEPEAARILVERGTRAVDGGFVWAFDPRLRLSSALRLTEAQVLAFFRKITCPVLVVRGRQGFPFPRALFEARAAAISDLRVIEVEGGHHLHLEHPERVAAAVGAHLLGVNPKRPSSPPAPP